MNCTAHGAVPALVLFPNPRQSPGICTNSQGELDGNLFRVFYDFAWELPDRGGKEETIAEREEVRASLTALSLMDGKRID